MCACPIDFVGLDERDLKRKERLKGVIVIVERVEIGDDLVVLVGSLKNNGCCALFRRKSLYLHRVESRMGNGRDARRLRKVV